MGAKKHFYYAERHGRRRAGTRTEGSVLEAALAIAPKVAVVEFAGLRQSRVAQSTGTRVLVYDGAAQGLDTAGGRWYTECSDHGCAVAHDTLRMARWMAPSPESWCERCAELDPSVPSYRDRHERA